MAGSGSPLGINERKEIKRLLGKMSMTKIAERIHRSKNCVITEVRNNGGVENYDPVQAEKRSEQVWKEGRERANIINDLKGQLQDAKNLKQRVYEEKQEVHLLKQEIKKELEMLRGINPIYFKRRDDRFSRLDRRLKVLEELYKSKKTNEPEEPIAPQDKLIYASEWEKVHHWPSHSTVMSLISKRDENGLNQIVLKPGTKWLIKEKQFAHWLVGYKEQMMVIAEEKEKIRREKKILRIQQKGDTHEETNI